MAIFDRRTGKLLSDILKHPVTAFLGVLLTGVTGSLIAGHFQNTFNSLIDHANKQLTIKWSIFIFIILLFVAVTFLSSSVLLNLFKDNKVKDGLQKLIALDDNLLSFWKESMREKPESPNPRAGIEKIVSCAKEFFDVTIGETDIGIFKVDDSSANHLNSFFHTRPIIHTSTSYWIGIEASPDPQHFPRGVVGRTFIEDRIIVTHVKWDKSLKRCLADQDDFHFPFNPRVKANCRYHSMTTIPLKDVHDKPIGVVAFYSSYTDVFDSEESQEMLLQISKRISAALIPSAKIT
jgi:hypothetical protein